MADVDPKQSSGLTLLGYCARVALAMAIVVIGLKIMIAHWPCHAAPISACPS